MCGDRVYRLHCYCYYYYTSIASSRYFPIDNGIIIHTKVLNRFLYVINDKTNIIFSCRSPRRVRY